MDPERWRQIEEAYYSILEAPAGQRHELLEQAGQTDPELRREVESLLHSEGHAGDFLSPDKLRDHIARVGNMAKSPSVGTHLGDYEILSVLGAGAMGEVYRARDRRLGREVALKTLPPHLTFDPARVARFQSEARAASALNHPNTITVYEIGQAAGAWFIAAEFIPGVTLRERLKNGKLALGEVLAIALQCTAALEAAHAAGIIHRDIKPENIMIRSDGVVKVVDFGLARILQPQPEWAVEATQTGSVMGTPRYMSPEQACGHAVDARTDIFSLGAVLYEMTTGHPAFPGTTTAEVFAALLRSEPTLADAGPLGPILSKAFAKDPAARYQTIDQFAAALRKASQGVHDFPSPEGLPFIARPRPIAGGARKAGVTAALLAAAAWAFYTWISRPVARDGALQLVPLATFDGPKGFPAFSPDGSRVAFCWQPPGSNARHLYVKPVGEGQPVQLTSSRYDDAMPAWSPDGRQIAFCRQSNGDQDTLPQEIRIVSVDNGEERKVTEAWRGVSWSPDGKTLALAHVPNGAMSSARETGGIFLLSLQSGQTRDLTAAQEDSHPVFSPDGKWIAFKHYVSGTEAQIFVVRPSGGPARRLTTNPFPTRAPAWSADSREIIFASLRSGANGSLWRVGLDGGAPRPVSATLRDTSDPNISRQGRLAYREEWNDTNFYLLTAQDPGADPGRFGDPVAWRGNSSREDHTPAFSPDGKRVAFVSDRSGYLEIWTALRDGSQEVPLTSLRAQNTGSPRWSPDGRQIAFDSWAGGKSGIYVVNAEGGAPRRLTPGPFGSWMPAWSPDGNWIYFSRGVSSPSEIWKTPAVAGKAVQVTHFGAFESRPSPDGSLVYFTKKSPDGGAVLWSIPTSGGVEKPVPELQRFTRIGRAWGLIQSGLYFVSYEDSPRQTVRFLSFRTHQVTPLFTLEKQQQWGINPLALSPDGHYALVTQLDHAVNELMMMENFR